MVEKDIVIFTGYSRRTSEETAGTMKRMVEQAVPEVRIHLVDPFLDVKNESWLFAKFLLTPKKSDDFIRSIDRQLEEKGLKGKKILAIMGYSYGAMGIFQKIISAEHYILLSPALGKGTVKWKGIEKLFGFLAGFKEMKSQEFQERILDQLDLIKKAGSKITFFLPCPIGGASIPRSDDRVEYGAELLNRLLPLGKIISFEVENHVAMIRSKNVADEIIKLIGDGNA